MSWTAPGLNPDALSVTTNNRRHIEVALLFRELALKIEPLLEEDVTEPETDEEILFPRTIAVDPTRRLAVHRLHFLWEYIDQVLDRMYW